MNWVRFFMLACATAVGPMQFTAAENDPITITEYGAVGNGKVLCTEAIRQAVDACVRRGGGRVLVPPGIYVTGPIELFSHVTLYLESGAVLQGSTDIAHYRKDNRVLPLVYAKGAENVGIVGDGTIDGSGTAFMDMTKTRTGPDMPGDLDPKVTRQGDDYMDRRFGEADGPVVYRRRPSRMLRFTDCRDVQIRNVTLKNSACWTLHLEDCEDVDVTGIDLINNLLVPNSDGIHCTSCRRVHISDCEISCGDDAVCVTSVTSKKDGFCQDVTVSNCTLQSRSSGVRLGYGRNTIRNCTFQNLVIRESNRGIGLFVRDEGSIENCVFSNIVIETRLHTGHWWGNGEPIHLSVIPQKKESVYGKIRNIMFHNIIAHSESGIVIYGHRAGDITGISLHDVRLHIRNSPLNKAYGGNFDLRPAYDKNLCIFKHDIPALYCRHVERLSLRNVDLSWDSNLPEFFNHAVYAEHVRDLTIDALQGRQPHPKDSRAAIAVHYGRDVIVRNCTAADGTGTFLSHQNLENKLMFINNNMQQARQVIAKPNDMVLCIGNLMP